MDTHYPTELLQSGLNSPPFTNGPLEEGQGPGLEPGLPGCVRCLLHPGRRTPHLDVWTDVHIAGPQGAQTAFLLWPALAVDVGDAGGDPQAAAGGAGTPRASVGYAVPMPWLHPTRGCCGYRDQALSFQPLSATPPHPQRPQGPGP